MNVIGIDPGASGGITLINANYQQTPVLEWTEKMPSEHEIVALLEGVGRPRFAFIESVHSMPGQGVSSTFKFGTSYGFLRGVLSALGIPFELVTPGVWQRNLGCLSKGDKNITKSAAQRLWPHIKWTHATADSALIAEWGRRRLHETGRL